MVNVSEQSKSIRRRYSICGLTNDNLEESIPLVYAKPSERPRRHWYLGGRPPILAAGHIPKGFEFVVTIPFAGDSDTDQVCSLIVGDFDSRVALSGTWTDSDLVRPILHDPSPRLAAWAARVELLGEADVVLGNRQVDPVDDVDNSWKAGVEGSKLGGRPFFLSKERLAEEWNLLEEKGFRQVLQMDWPDIPIDLPFPGNWPFGGGMLSLAIGPRAEKTEWRWCWQIG